MNGLIIFLLCAPVLAQWFPIAASQGGHTTWQVFFCQNPGCAANVTCVYCNDELLHSHTHIPDCSGPPPPRTVCKHDGRAFISTDPNADCEFEGISGYIKTEKCTVHSKICDFNRDDALGRIVGGVVCLICLLVGLSLCFCKKRRCREQDQQPISDSDVTSPLEEIKSTKPSERDCGVGPGLDGGSSPQCDQSLNSCSFTY